MEVGKSLLNVEEVPYEYKVAKMYMCLDKILKDSESSNCTKLKKKLYNSCWTYD